MTTVCVQALDHGPVSVACCDLTTQEPLDSAPRLAVRGTAWRSATRPHFSNTWRTMTQVVARIFEPISAQNLSVY